MRAEELAAWCLLTGFPPAVYLELSRLERDAFTRLAMRKR